MAQVEHSERPADEPSSRWERDAFVYLPASERPAGAPDGAPPRAWTVTRMALAVTIVSALAAGALYALGLLVKLQLDRFFAS